MKDRPKSTGLVQFKHSHEERRESILTSLSGFLQRRPKVLWYVETLALSARYFQRVTASQFGVGEVKPRYSHREKLWTEAVIPHLTSSGRRVHVAEFGVATGKATVWWHNNLPSIERWDGFDTFEGLPEPWTRGGVTVMNQGVFAPIDPDSPFPKIPGKTNLAWHKGLICDTIAQLSRSDDEVLLVLIDVDLLEPTRDVLEWLMDNGRPGDCVYFDEAFDPFNEGLALSEAIEKGFKFRVLGYTGSSLAVVLV